MGRKGRVMRTESRTLLVTLLIAASTPALAASTPTLTLAGCAERRVLLVPLYAVRLYLPPQAEPEEAAFDPALPKSMDLKVTYPGNVPGSMPEGWRKRFEERRLSSAQITTLNTLYQNLNGGDVLSIAYQPGQGSIVRLNGAPQIVDPGAKLIEALLDIWMGPRALHPEMRVQLLSGTCRDGMPPQ